jgi:hypothetical protein
MKIAMVALAFAVAIASTTSANALDRRVRINNYTSYDIIEFYASNKDATTWQEDILGRNILPSGNSVVINIDDGTGYCMYDFRAVFEDGDELVKYGNNVCEMSDFNYRD